MDGYKRSFLQLCGFALYEISARNEAPDWTRNLWARIFSTREENGPSVKIGARTPDAAQPLPLRSASPPGAVILRRCIFMLYLGPSSLSVVACKGCAFELRLVLSVARLSAQRF